MYLNLPQVVELTKEVQEFVMDMVEQKINPSDEHFRINIKQDLNPQLIIQIQMLDLIDSDESVLIHVAV